MVEGFGVFRIEIYSRFPLRDSLVGSSKVQQVLAQ